MRLEARDYVGLETGNDMGLKSGDDMRLEARDYVGLKARDDVSNGREIDSSNCTHERRGGRRNDSEESYRLEFHCQHQLHPIVF